MRLTRREFAKLLALGLGAGAAAGAAGLPPLARAALAAPGGKGLAVALDPALPVHPALQYGALAEPDKVVRVLVQTVLPQDDGRAIAAAHGAAHREEFAFVKSHVFELPQRAVPRLGLHPHVLYVSPDGPVQRHATTIATTNLKTIYPLAIRADAVWNGNPAATGAGVTIAVLDTGVNAGHPDLGSNLVAISANKRALGTQDGHGHGTHVVGIIKGRDLQGRYLGVAPDARVISVKVADDTGAATDSDMVAGLQWVYHNRAAYKIKVAVIAFSASLAVTYTASAIAAYCEQLWQAGVTVVVAAGNRGSAPDATWYAPGNDPWLISVGALDDNETVAGGDDTLAAWSSRGYTQDVTHAGTPIYKPEIVAPGRRLVAPLASSGCTLGASYPDRVTDGRYIRLSGTSMAAPVVGGVIALLLERFPALTPNQIKWLLTSTERAYPGQADGAGVIDPVALLARAARGSIGSANAGLARSSEIDPVGGAVATGYWDQGYWDQAGSID